MECQSRICYIARPMSEKGWGGVRGGVGEGGECGREEKEEKNRREKGNTALVF